MMRRVLPWIVVLLVLLGIGAPFALKAYRAYEVRRVVSRYDLLLSQGLENLEPEIISEVATDEEVSRVGSYSTYLWGNNIRLESDLLELKVLSVSSEAETMTAVVRESWRYQERDRTSGSPLGDPWEETQELDYTLVRDGDRLMVHRSSVREPSAEENR